MKTVSSDAIGDFITDQIDGPISAPIIKTEYYSDTQSTWNEIPPEYVEARSISLSSENDRYQVQSFIPPVRDLKLTLNNYDQGWNDDGARSGIITKNRLIRCWSGLQIPEGTDTTLSDDYTTNAKFVNTVKSGSTVTSQIGIYSGTIATAAELLVNTYGSSATYGSAVYGYLGYYTKRFLLPELDEAQATHLKLTASSDKFSFKYRVGNNDSFLGSTWQSYKSVSSGVNSFGLTADVNQNHIEYIVRFDGNTYGADNISNVELHYSDQSELFKQGTFILDQPKFNEKVQANGRDYLRKALETEINLPTITSEPITTTLTKVFDRCNIPYDTATWDLTSTTVTLNATLAEDIENESGYKLADKLMTALNAGNDDWKFKFTEDGKAQVKIIPTATEADFLAHYFFHIESITKDLDSDKQLQRVTAVNKDIIVNAESLLKSVSGGATSSLTVTYSDALYVRYEDNNNTILSETARTNGSVSLSMTASAYNIDVYGCTPKNAITDEVWAEKGNSNNIISNDGNTYKNVNPFFTANMGQEYADYLINRRGDPAKRVQLSMLRNPLSELDDNFLVFSLETSDNTLYTLNKITEQWTNPGMKHNLTLIDSGVAFTNFIWDRNGTYQGVNDIKYDTSLIWDYDLGISATGDPVDYSNTKKVFYS
jgi:hypothetical protein